MPARTRPMNGLRRLVACALLIWSQHGLAHGAGSDGNRPGNALDTAVPARRALLSDEPHAFQWGLHIDADTVGTLQGGVQRGTVANNVIHAALAIDTGPQGWWRGGRFAASALRITSGEASANNIGDLQVADNLDAPSASRLYQAWYRQRFGRRGGGPRFSVRGGLLDLNQNFAAVDTASTLLNASFGLDPTLSANVPISTYPKPGLGVEGGVRWSRWGLRLGVFQPNPADRGSGFHHGNLVIGELGYRTGMGTHEAARYKLGLWRYRQTDPALTGTPAHDWGAYATVEARPPHAPDGLRMFLHLGHAPDATNMVPYYLGAGLQMHPPVEGRPYDLFTAGIAHARIRDGAADAGAETSYEISYLINLRRFVTLQPDLQYIRHPGGRGDINDAIVGLLRLHLEFF